MELEEYLIDRFQVGDFDEKYYCLEDRLDISAIFTTNIDNLIHRIFEESRDVYINDIDQSGPVYGNRRSIDYVPPHGSIMKSERPLRFSATDIASSFGADPDRWLNFQKRLQQHPTIIWGCSLEDAPILEAIVPATSRTGAPQNIWILVHPSSDQTATIDYFQALNFKIMVGNTQDLLSYFQTNLQVRQNHITILDSASTKELFPSGYVPSAGSVPNRPIIEFFRGAAPMWCDIYSGNLYRTSYYDAVQESIFSGNNTIITGIPGSGKTTLLMQLAAHLNYEGHKLIYSELSSDETQLIIRRLDGAKAIIFVDNFTNDSNILSRLHQTSNIQFVASDRDYYLSSILHLIPRGECNIINITELTEADLQGCRLSIPLSIRKPGFVSPEVTPGVKPSLFEFVQENITDSTLRERFERALRDLRLSSQRLAEMLLFVSYVHSCRTPVSMDMAIAYWRGKISDYEEIYSLHNNVGSLLTEYEGDLADEPQDYFAARSLLAAEAVLNAARQQSFRDMLLIFHKNISPTRICHYDIFKRHAYNHKLLNRAFHSWGEGLQFYDMIYRKDENPYILQHQALFLSERGRHKEAFSAIDQALAESRSTNWTIRNSHAIILFRANVNFFYDQNARKTLDQSMEILRECYYSDRRKAFHAMTFADLALRYWKAYRDERAYEYLNYANKWLLEQEEAEPWISDIPRLIRIVQRYLD